MENGTTLEYEPENNFERQAGKTVKYFRERKRLRQCTEVFIKSKAD